MSARRTLCISALAAALLLPGIALAAPLTEARVTRVINDVRVVDPAGGARRASLNDTIKDDLVLTTGVKSRSELLFQDDTLTRIGPETSFSFTAGSRDMKLERGTMLLQVSKGLGGARIHTAAVTAAITGTTIMLEHLPRRSIKVLVLEGSLRLSVNGRFGDSLLLLPGRMVIMKPDAKRIPEPVAVDLAKVMKTSSLVKADKNARPLPSAELIQQEIDSQANAIAKRELIPTNLVIDGQGTNVTLAANNVIDTLTLRTDDQANEPAGSSDNGGAQASPTPAASPAASPTPGSSVTPAPTATAQPSATPTPELTATPEPSSTPQLSPTPGSSASPSATPSATATPTPDEGGDDDGEAGDEQHPVKNFGTADHPIEGDVTIDTSINLGTRARTGTVNVNATGKVTVDAKIRVSKDSGPSSPAGGNVTIDSRKATETAIHVTSSGQLLSLLDAAAPGPGGTIRFTSAGGDINVNGGHLQADRGTIAMTNNGPNGAVNLSNATLRSNVVKVSVLGENGQLNVGGGTISADSVINLYAGGSNGQVKFTDNVTLSGNSVKTITGQTVTIVDGKVVTVSGPAPANVFTDRPNYSGSGGNGSSSGTFGGAGAVTQPRSASPGPGG